ncbi:unnamed protein product [Schistocephalus solidus]|uniref:Uncharacterized protein n=1 Tax=Schistocephalus solidus TaxID=70667 RepID=A0A3P7DF06_SCHSO|nr:unnamed protein product [Schistocephalus solidus]
MLWRRKRRRRRRRRRRKGKKGKHWLTDGWNSNKIIRLSGEDGLKEWERRDV